MKSAREPKTNIGEQNKFAGAFIKRGIDQSENYAREKKIREAFNLRGRKEENAKFVKMKIATRSN